MTFRQKARAISNALRGLIFEVPVYYCHETGETVYEPFEPDTNDVLEFLEEKGMMISMLRFALTRSTRYWTEFEESTGEGWLSRHSVSQMEVA